MDPRSGRRLSHRGMLSKQETAANFRGNNLVHPIGKSADAVTMAHTDDQSRSGHFKVVVFCPTDHVDDDFRDFYFLQSAFSQKIFSGFEVVVD